MELLQQYLLLPFSLASLQLFLSSVLFSLALSSVVLSFALVLLLRLRPPWCNCAVCYAYVTSSWHPEFPNLCDWLTHLLLSSPTRTVHIHVLSNVITANPLNVHHMLKSRFDNYPKGRPFSSILGDFLGCGIFNVDGPHWRFQRKLSALELGSTSVRSFAFRIVSDEIHLRLLPFLHHHSSSLLDLQAVFRRFAFDTICKISFGLDPRCLELSLPITEFAAAFDTASALSAARATYVSPLAWKLKRFLRVGSERRLRRSIRLVDELAREVIQQRRKELQLNGGTSSRDDLLSRFMGSVTNEGYLRDIVVSFLLAGRDTVASCLTCLFYLLSRNPSAQGEMVEEIERVTGGRKEGKVTWEELRGMGYVHAAVYESLRLYPPVQQDSKYAAGEDVLPDGTRVQRGTRVTYYPYAMGRLPEEWGEDCMEFRPRRWLRGGEFAGVGNPYSYPVFQAGARSCLGQEMAVMEAKAVAVEVLRRFRVRVKVEGGTLRFAPGLTASVAGGLAAVVTPQSDR